MEYIIITHDNELINIKADAVKFSVENIAFVNKGEDGDLYDTVASLQVINVKEVMPDFI
ncbi:hypothetical protein [Terribacillus sp. 7520-G]|uniref:hypothetical protein n=1 Tax=Terribacillus sp. 7520-G TaxID=2025389 RepID=UPI0013040FF7|nr:hypothetical protein [Terribacillus sp. 7520-G]